MRRLLVVGYLLLLAAATAAVPVTVVPVTAPHGMVVAAHPQAAAIGAAVLKGGGNAIDAAVATSLAVGVAEPFGSGLGGKLMLLFREAKTGRVYVVDAMDACGSGRDVVALRLISEEGQHFGYSAVCVPGLAAGLWAAHQKWGAKKWSEDVIPAILLAREGFEVLPKTRDLFEEQEKKLRRGDPDLARIYLPGGALPAVGSRLKNEDLSRTLELLARRGRDGFYTGEIADAIVRAAAKGGGQLTKDDFARYEARIVEPLTVDFRGYRVFASPPPSHGAAIFLPVLKALENEDFGGGPLRSPENLEKIARVWRIVQPQASRAVGDVPEARARVEKLLAPESIADIRRRAAAPDANAKKLVSLEPAFSESPEASTTHFIVVDAQGNIVCATQSQSSHFGAGVIPPGTGVVLNDSMSNFAYLETRSPNLVAPGKRARSTVSPTIVERAGRPVFALGAPGFSRIPSALLQGLLDRLALDRPLAEAIGDTRFHFAAATSRLESEAFEAERSLPAATVEQLTAKGWTVRLPEEPGRGRHFGGLNAVEFNADGTLTGYADPRRTNAAAGY